MATELSLNLTTRNQQKDNDTYFTPIDDEIKGINGLLKTIKHIRHSL